MTNRTSPIKRRRTQADMAELRAGLLELVRVHAPVTCRQAFYLAVAAGLVEKTEGQYNATGKPSLRRNAPPRSGRRSAAPAPMPR